MKRLLIIYLSVLACLGASAATKTQADSLYSAENYKAAAVAYNDILHTQGISSEL